LVVFVAAVAAVGFAQVLAAVDVVLQLLHDVRDFVFPLRIPASAASRSDKLVELLQHLVILN
jgi:heme A synthase